MTDKEKAKAYEMALEGARKELGVDRKEREVVQQVLHNIFPELRESEDERIRKQLIKLVKSHLVNHERCMAEAWLEKQKDAFENGRQLGIMQEQARQELEWPEPKEQIELKHYWKPTETDVALFNKAVTTNKALTPAERAQLDIIRSKFGCCRAINCSGIMQKEQKPVEHHWEQMEWADIDFDEFTENVRHLIIDKLTISSPSAEGGVSIDDKTAKEIANGILFFIGPQKPAWSEEEKEKIRQNGRLDVCYNPEKYGLCHKIEWSEEDEKTLNDLLWLCDRWDEGINNVLPSKEAITKTRKMLKSLRPSWKPSEQEKGALRIAIHILTNESFLKAAAQLQSILDAFEGKESRKDWKPSEEQMNSLRDTIVQTKGYSYSVYLPELYEQLQKLKGSVAPMKEVYE